jgi:hypothetical protein
MPGRSPHEVVLSDAERAELRHRAACYTRPHREVERARLVLLAAEGKTNVEIGELLGMSREAVGRWRRRFCEQRLEGLEGLEDLKRTGRPRRPPGRGRSGEGGPRKQGVPLSRFSRAELHRLVIERGATEASAATIARWLARRPGVPPVASEGGSR